MIEAIDEGSSEMLKEELGDLILQVVFHSELAREKGEFDISDVIEGLINKLVSRHPHVFGDAEAKSAEDVLTQWHKLKEEEKRSRQGTLSLQAYPPHMPSLQRAHKITQKAARVGFDWGHIDQVFEKVKEEIMEFEQAVEKNSPEEMESELGTFSFHWSMLVGSWR